MASRPLLLCMDKNDAGDDEDDDDDGDDDKSGGYTMSRSLQLLQTGEAAERVDGGTGHAVEWSASELRGPLEPRSLVVVDADTAVDRRRSVIDCRSTSVDRATVQSTSISTQDQTAERSNRPPAAVWGRAPAQRDN